MRKVFSCKILTPMFLHGADGETPELRESSLKASIRYWWRAINSNLRLPEMRKREAEIFGGSYTEEDNKEKSFKSSFNLIAKDISLKDQKMDRLPTKDKPAPAESYVSGNFEVTIITQEAFLKARNIKSDSIENIFKLSTILGDVGKRSRRGFGSFHIIDQPDPTFESIYNLINLINPDMYIYNATNNFIEVNENKVKNLDYPYLKKIEISNYIETSKDLTEKVYKASHDNDKDSLGFVNKQQRFASPIYISAIKSGNSLKAIISTLNTYPSKDFKNLVQEQEDFKKVIL